MAKITFRKIRMNKANKERLAVINQIIEDYQAQGYVLTLRQLYYQLVSRDVIPNSLREYAKLSVLLKEGRMAGVVDWDAIEDRLRKPEKPASFDSPIDILSAAIGQYQRPRMNDQQTYVEVWVEKDALSGVLKRVTNKYHIPILVNRGYSSASAMFDSYQRFLEAYHRNQKIKILYLGDYDPSGIDMIRDVRDRTLEFMKGGNESIETLEEAAIEYKFSVESIALTIEQINQYEPPPNPAKMSDPRANKFVAQHGKTSWEVDALKPEVLNQLLDDAILENINLGTYEEIVSSEQADRDKLRTLYQYL